MAVCVGLAPLLALTPRREGSLGDTRLGPIARALPEALDAEARQAGNPAPADGAAAAAVPEQTPEQPDTS
jgi:hypothetical protein